MTAENNKMNISEINIMPEFHEFIPSAILRLSYLFPDAEITSTPNGLKVLGVSQPDAARFEKEANYQIYREKIFQETLPLRQSLYQILAN